MHISRQGNLLIRAIF